MKGYKIWDPASRKKAYSRNVVFREVGSKTDPKENFQTENNLETVWFELRNEEDDSGESTELEEEMEQPTPVVRRSKRVRKSVKRYSPPDFLSTFMLTTINDDPKLVGEEFDSVEGKISGMPWLKRWNPCTRMRHGT
jgi:hypothetical protein